MEEIDGAAYEMQSFRLKAMWVLSATLSFLLSFFFPFSPGVVIPVIVFSQAKMTLSHFSASLSSRLSARPPPVLPSYRFDSGLCCIRKYRPSVTSAYQKMKLMDREIKGKREIRGREMVNSRSTCPRSWRVERSSNRRKCQRRDTPPTKALGQ